jgi:exosortase O
MNTHRWHWAGFSMNLLLVGLWFSLFRAIYPYLVVIFTSPQFRENQFILAGVGFLVALKACKIVRMLKFDRPPHWHAPALIIALGSSIAFLLVDWFLDINTLSASLFLFATYGLAGIYMQPSLWKRGLPVMLLLAGSLPFGEHLQTFIGYPVRLATAEIVRTGFSGLGIPTLTTQTILVFESGISQVDLPCSGVKSLWTGWMFLLAATWLERRSLNLRWVGIASLVGVVLLAANLLRVGVLVGVGQAAGFRLLAEMLHLPLGVLGFGAGCWIGVWLLRKLPVAASSLDQVLPSHCPAWLAPALAALLVPLVLLPGKPAQPENIVPAREWVLPAEEGFTPWALSPQEQEWLTRSGMGATSRWRFSDPANPGVVSGVLLVTASDTWRAQHRPEQCFEVFDLKTRQSFSILAAPGFPVRVLSLENSRTLKPSWAVYWLQSREMVTDEFAARIWDDLSPERQTWVLVTILFDPPTDPKSEGAQAWFVRIRDLVQVYLDQANLKGGFSYDR